jgi:hypothetical protein
MRTASGRMPKLLAALVMAAATCTEACAADLYGRVFDTLRGSMYPHAVIRLGSGAESDRRVTSDESAQFRFEGVQPGVYIVRIAEPGGREVIGRLRVTGRPATQIAHLDLAKIDPPDEGDEY